MHISIKQLSSEKRKYRIINTTMSAIPSRVSFPGDLYPLNTGAVGDEIISRIREIPGIYLLHLTPTAVTITIRIREDWNVIEPQVLAILTAMSEETNFFKKTMDRLFKR